MAKYNLSEGLINRSWEGDFLLCMLTEMSTETLGIKPREIGGPPIEVDVIVAVNGVEVPFTKFIERLGHQFESMVNLRAKKLVEERLGQTFRATEEALGSISSSLDDLKIAVQEKADHIFPDYSNEDT